MPNFRRFLFLVAFAVMIGGTLFSSASVITQPTSGGISTADLPLVIAGSNISCPTCAATFDSSVAGVVLGGYIGISGGNGFTSPGGTRVIGNFIQSPIPAAGWFTNTCVHMRAASAQGTLTRTYFLLNGKTSPSTAAGLEYYQTTILPGNPGGVVCSPSSSKVVRVEQGDYVNFYRASRGNTENLDGFTFQFFPDTAGEGILFTGWRDSTIVASSTQFLSFSSGTTSGPAFSSTEGPVRLVVPFDATLQDLHCTTDAPQPASGTLTFTVRNNGADSSVIATVPTSGLVSSYTDFTNTSAISAGDTVNLEMTNNATGISASLAACSLGIVPDTGTPSMIGMRINNAFGSGTTNFATPLVLNFSTTDANQRQPVNRAGTASNLYAFVDVASGAGATTAITLMKNGVATALTGTIAALASGSISLDLVNTETFVATDNWSVRIVQTNASGAHIASLSFQYD